MVLSFYNQVKSMYAQLAFHSGSRSHMIRAQSRGEVFRQSGSPSLDLGHKFNSSDLEAWLAMTNLFSGSQENPLQK